MKLSSVVYALFISEPLLKPVKLEIKHYAHVVFQKHTSYLSFVVASLKRDGPYYNFDMKKGGQFYVSKEYGSICLSDSTLIAVVTSDKQLNEELALESSAHLSLDCYHDEEVYLHARELEHIICNILPFKLDTDHVYVCISPVLALSIHSYNKYEPLVFLWQKPILPEFFQAFILNLCSSAPKCFEVSFPQLGKIESCKTVVSLKCVNIGGEVLLVETECSIDVYYSGQPKNCHRIHEMIKKEMHAVITSTEKFQDMIDFNEGLHCHGCDTEGYVKKHICVLQSDKKHLRCYKAVHQINSERQLPWFHSEPEGKLCFEVATANCLKLVLIHTKFKCPSNVVLIASMKCYNTYIKTKVTESS